MAARVLIGLALLGTATGGCPPTENVLSNAEGQSIRLSAIDDILNTDLTEEQKRQGLRDLGITNDELIELLLRERAGT